MANRTDSYNRANSAVTPNSPSDAAGDYTVAAGTWGISSNQGYCPTSATPAAIVLESSTSSVEVQVTIATKDGNAGLCARYSDVNNHWMFYTDAGGDRTRLYKLVAGSFVQMIDNAGAPTSGDVLKLTFNGDVWTAYINAVQVGTGSDSFNNTATKHGLWAYADVSLARWDTFSITDLGGAANRRRRVLTGGL
jgi:hypothetical protein